MTEIESVLQYDFIVIINAHCNVVTVAIDIIEMIVSLGFSRFFLTSVGLPDALCHIEPITVSVLDSVPVFPITLFVCSAWPTV